MTTLAKIVRLTCVQCGAHYREGEHLYTCPACGIEGILDVEYDYDVARASMKTNGLGTTPADRLGSIWRYIDLLPVTGEKGLPKLQVGGTPLVDAPRLAKLAGVASVVLKDDGRLPTASFKDRASAVGTTKARELGYAKIACSSTGNAASCPRTLRLRRWRSCGPSAPPCFSSRGATTRRTTSARTLVACTVGTTATAR